MLSNKILTKKDVFSSAVERIRAFLAKTSRQKREFCRKVFLTQTAVRWSRGRVCSLKNILITFFRFAVGTGGMLFENCLRRFLFSAVENPIALFNNLPRGSFSVRYNPRERVREICKKVFIKNTRILKSVFLESVFLTSWTFLNWCAFLKNDFLTEDVFLVCRSRSL